MIKIVGTRSPRDDNQCCLSLLSLWDCAGNIVRGSTHSWNRKAAKGEAFEFWVRIMNYISTLVVSFWEVLNFIIFIFGHIIDDGVPQCMHRFGIFWERDPLFLIYLVLFFCFHGIWKLTLDAFVSLDPTSYSESDLRLWGLRPTSTRSLAFNNLSGQSGQILFFFLSSRRYHDSSEFYLA